MDFYILLFVSLLIIFSLTIIIWSKLRDISILISFFLIYYVTLYGAWAIVYDNLGGDSTLLGFHYHYLYYKLFPISLNEDYFKALVIYTIFIITVQLALLFFYRAKKQRIRSKPIVIDHAKLLLLSSMAGFLSYLIMGDYIGTAIEIGVSAYQVSRGVATEGGIPLFTMHQILSRVALVPSSIGLAVYLCGEQGKLIVGKKNQRHFLLGYVLVLAAMYVFSALLGNKNELFFSFLSGILFYLVNHSNPNKRALVLTGMIALISVILIDNLRALNPLDYASSIDGKILYESAISLLTSNEAYGSHFSMYGALKFNIPYTYGSSLISLAASVIPRFIWPSRPPSIYTHYAINVQAVAGQGYAIHHATGWYLNFGWVGVIIGAILLGWLWATLLNRFNSVQNTNYNLIIRIFVMIAPWTFVANLVPFMRAGPEAYKGMIIDAFFLPTIILFLSTNHFTVFKRNMAIPLRRNTSKKALGRNTKGFSLNKFS